MGLFNWGDGIARITAKLQAANDRLNELKVQQQELVLAAALDESGAAKKLEKLHAELQTAERSVADLQTALAQAQEKVATKQQETDAEAARERQRQIDTKVREHAANAHDIEESLKNLVAELDKHYQLNKALAKLVFDNVQARADLTDQEKQQWTNEANRLLGLSAMEARLRYFAYSYRLRVRDNATEDLGVKDFSLSKWLNAPPHDMNFTYKGATFREIEQEIIDLAVFNKQPKSRPQPKLGSAEAEPVRTDGSHLPPGRERDIWLHNFNPKLYAARYGQQTREASAPLAKAVGGKGKPFTDDPKAIAEAEVEDARKAQNA